VIKKERMIIIPVITYVVLSSCSLLTVYALRKYSSNLDLNVFAKKIERYSMVEKVISIEENELDFVNTINIAILLKNGGYIGINNVSIRLKCHNAFFIAIGPYRFHKDFYDPFSKRTIRGNLISIENIEESLEVSLYSLKDVLKNYSTILAAVEIGMEKVDEMKRTGDRHQFLTE
jgi:hypothetical protein